MIKKISLILLLIISKGYSQEVNTDIREYVSFKEGTTYFVKSSDKKYNQIISDILTKYWTVNKFEMIASNQIEKLKGERSFFVDQVEYSFSREGGTTGALNMAYGVTKLAMFKDYKKNTPKGVLSLVQLDKVSPVEMLFAIQLMQSQINFVFELNTKKDLDIKDFLEEPDQKFILVYDFMRMWIFLIELIGYEKEGPESPQMLLAVGMAPPEDSRSGDQLVFGDETSLGDEDEDEFGFGDFDDDLSDEDFSNFDDYEY